MPNENLEIKNKRKISLCAYEIFTKIICLNCEITKHLISKDRFYIKKFNLSKDTSEWEGWSIESLALKPELKKVYFYYLRRKYIPPLLDSYTDFTFVTTVDFSKLKEEELSYYQNNGVPEVEMIIETVTDSIFSSFDSYLKDYYSILEARADSLSLDRSAMKYYLNSLLISGKETYRIGFQYVLKVIGFIIEKISSAQSFKDIFNLVLDKYIIYLQDVTKDTYTRE